VKQRPHHQQIIGRLMERHLKSRRSADCKLGREPLSRRGGSCSACEPPNEFELDQAIAQLINAGLFKGTRACPYRLIASHLVAGLVFGPEIFRARGLGRDRIDPHGELKPALKHVRAVLQACGLSDEDIEALSDKSPRWEGLYQVLLAERALIEAIELFPRPLSRNARRAPRGRTGVLANQALARALAGAWRTLTGRLPAKDNVRFHALLHAATTTVFGYPAKEPNWQSATRRAVKQIKALAASRT
jgi:hypothetical protein